VDEAAKQLGCTPASVKSRLQRGRERLRDRLAKRGFALSVALLMATLGQGHVQAVPPPLAASVRHIAHASPAPPSASELADALQHEWRWTNAIRAVGTVLTLGLLVALGRVITSDGDRAREHASVHTSDAAPRLAPSTHTEPAIDIDPNPVLGVSFDPRQRFGFVILNERDPANPDKYKKLTYMEDGSYNNTCVRIDGSEFLYGQVPGGWARDDRTGTRLDGITVVKDRKWVSAWNYLEKVRVTQTVVIVPNDDTRPAKLNTALVHYTVENRDRMPHRVGVRIMLDTYIGSNDGVPFALEGRPDLVTKKIDLRNTKEIPSYIMALERADLNDPGTAATMVLKFPGDFRLNSADPPLDPITRLVICRFPGNPEVRWDFTKEAFWDMDARVHGSEPDSCVTLYWPEITMPAHTRRALAFSYGLGKVSGAGGDGRLALTAPGKPAVGGQFSVTAWVKQPTPGQNVTLELPAGMSLAEPQAATQPVRAG
jgi:hypothetical protein